MRISLIISSLNSVKYISKAIDSFLVQSHQDKELIIFDNASKDGTHDVISKYSQENPTLIKWIREDDNGISDSRNKALKHATGDIIGFLGSDDVLHKDFFAQLPYYTGINPNFDVLYFNSYTIGDDFCFDASSQIAINRRNLIKYCPIASGESFYYKKEVFDKFQFNENNYFSMDYELNMAMATSKKEDGSSYKFFPVNIESVFNLSSGDSLSCSQSLKQRLETIAVQLKYSKCFFDKLKIISRRKKIVLRNLKTFLAIKNKVQ